jgi:hypothetical protein
MFRCVSNSLNFISVEVIFVAINLTEAERWTGQKCICCSICVCASGRESFAFDRMPFASHPVFVLCRIHVSARGPLQVVCCGISWKCFLQRSVIYNDRKGGGGTRYHFTKSGVFFWSFSMASPGSVVRPALQPEDGHMPKHVVVLFL